MKPTQLHLLVNNLLLLEEVVFKVIAQKLAHLASFHLINRQEDSVKLNIIVTKIQRRLLPMIKIENKRQLTINKQEERTQMIQIFFMKAVRKIGKNIYKIFILKDINLRIKNCFYNQSLINHSLKKLQTIFNMYLGVMSNQL